MANGLKIDERRKKILEILRRDGKVRTAQLSNILEVSPVTVRSDLFALERDGFLERIQGGGVQSTNNFYNLNSQLKKQKHADAKRRIAYAAAKMINDGDTLFINSGTTTYFTAVELKKAKNLNIVTNSIPVAMELGGVPTFRVILIGGIINTQYSFTFGERASEQISHFKADWAILSVDGICQNAGLTTYHAEEGTINRLMIERAAKTIIVADSSKLGRESFAKITGLSSKLCWVTDIGANLELTRQVSNYGVDIYLADKNNKGIE